MTSRPQIATYSSALIGTPRDARRTCVVRPPSITSSPSFMPLNLDYTHLEAQECPECGQTSLASRSSSVSGEHAASGTPLCLTDYLRSYGISDTDTEEINGVLPMLENDAAIYDQQIHRLKGVLRELRSRRDDTKASIKQLRSLLAPVRRLPREILDIICWHSLPNLWDEEGVGYCQLAFSQVCHT